MKVFTPQISWHACEAIYSVDFQASSRNSCTRLATCGVDTSVRLWNVCFERQALKEIASPTQIPKINFLSNLKRHQKFVNIVRWSPSTGEYLASGDDEGLILIWKFSNYTSNKSSLTNQSFNFSAETLGDGDEMSLENWIVYKSLRAHLQDICDLAWSHNSQNLISGSQDNSTILWDLAKGKPINVWKEATSFVQGVAIEAKGQLCACISRDRVLRIYDLCNSKCLHQIQKRNVADSKEEAINQRLFMDENAQGFFRRLTWSPDGQILLVPTGCIEDSDSTLKPVSYIFTRHSLPNPIAYVPSGGKSSSVIKFSPIIYKLRNPPSSFLELPYRLVFAVATDLGVTLYDSEQLKPLFYISNIHFWWLSDLSWTPDGNALIVSSVDGYCTFILFDSHELGEEVNGPVWSQPSCVNSPTTSVISSDENQSPRINSIFHKERELASTLTESPFTPPRIQVFNASTSNIDSTNPALLSLTDKEKVPLDSMHHEVKRRITPLLISSTKSISDSFFGFSTSTSFNDSSCFQNESYLKEDKFSKPEQLTNMQSSTK